MIKCLFTEFRSGGQENIWPSVWAQHDHGPNIFPTVRADLNSVNKYIICLLWMGSLIFKTKKI